MTAAQLDMLDILAEADDEARTRALHAMPGIAGFIARHDAGRLITGELCPGCGTAMPGRCDGGQWHRIRTPLPLTAEGPVICSRGLIEAQS